MLAHYEIETQTGSQESSGTDAKVYIQFIQGDNAKVSKEFLLDNPDKDDFVRGHLDHFRIEAEDFGWIDKIRLFHDNSGNGPGWFVDWVKVTQVENGLTWQVNFNCWFAVNKGDMQIDRTSEVPLDVSVSTGVLETLYVGYEFSLVVNETSEEAQRTTEFTSTYEAGSSVETSKSFSSTLGAELSFQFFAGAKFTASVTAAVAETTGSTMKQTFEYRNVLDLNVAPHSSQTIVDVYFQNVLSGDVEAGGVTAKYSTKMAMMSSQLMFGEVLTPAEVQARVREYLSGATEARLPSMLPKTRAAIPVARVVLTKVDAASVAAARQQLSARLIRPAVSRQIRPKHGAGVLNSRMRGGRTTAEHR